MQLNQYIDHTLLKPDCTKDQITQLCEEAIEHDFYAVCIPPYHIKTASSIVSESNVKVATVIGFPLGYQPTETKNLAILRASLYGANEVDSVINLAALKEDNWNYLSEESKRLTTAAHHFDMRIKFILETGMLEESQIIKLCEMFLEAEADFVKTSTGFLGTGATVEAVAIMKKCAGNKMEVKASGGIRTYEQAVQMIEAGATRLGTSSGITLVKEDK